MQIFCDVQWEKLIHKVTELALIDSSPLDKSTIFGCNKSVKYMARLSQMSESEGLTLIGKIVQKLLIYIKICRVDLTTKGSYLF